MGVDGHLYVALLSQGKWILTCDSTGCIDKRSSAELSEAINSMFEWYRSATVCFVYMNDVQADWIRTTEPQMFSKSAWFTRGWTLQELLAPSRIVFCDVKWRTFGCICGLSKVERANFEAAYGLSLASRVATITGIDCKYLTDKVSSAPALYDASIAERLSWTSKRVATRREDAAYCLLGIFQINMPLLYGKGSKAFLRLQQELVRQSTDKSIFAWTKPPHLVTAYVGILAKNPWFFRDSSAAHPCIDGIICQITRRGLHLETPSVKITHEEYYDQDFFSGNGMFRLDNGDMYFLSFQSTAADDSPPPITIALVEKHCFYKDQFVRICIDGLDETMEDAFKLSDRAVEPVRSFYIDME